MRLHNDPNLFEQYKNKPIGEFEVTRLKMLKRALKLYKRAGNISGQGHALHEMANALSAVVSEVRNDELALDAALAATNCFVETQKYGYAAETENLAGDLLTVPRKLREFTSAQKHFDNAALYYSLAGFSAEAAEVRDRIKAWKSVYPSIS